MNKLGIVLGAAAIVTLAGCKDPNYKYDTTKASQNEVKSVETAPAEQTAPKCLCPPGTKHASPCTCGAPDCKCVVEKPIVVTEVKPAPAPVKKAVEPAAPEYTIYVVQSGDYLAKISKRYNVTIDSIKRLNPSIKKDVIWVGQKLKLPGKVDVPAPAANPAPAAAKKADKKSFSSYTGATKDYVVKSGDTLGAIAYGNGINIRQLKELNGLTKDAVFVGQKLKVPTEKVAKAAKPAKAVKAAAKKPVAAKKPAVAKQPEAKPAEPVVQEAAPVAEPVPAPEANAVESVAPVAAEAPVEAPVAAPADAAAPEAAKPEAAPAQTTTYVVQEGDDMTGVSIRWGVSAAEIRELNNLSDTDQLVPGQIIKLPADAQQ